MNTKFSYDYSIIALVTILSTYGIVMMYSASAIIAINHFDNYLYFLKKQLFWFILGFLLMWICMNINYRHLKSFAYPLIFLSFIFLFMGYFFKGPNPASRWLIIGGRSLMTTSDFARISLIIFTAYFIDANRKNIHQWTFLLKNYTPYFLGTILLILFQPDTSTTLVISLIIIVMLFIGGSSGKYLLGLITIGLSGVMTKILLTDYQWKRILSWKAGNIDYQKIHSFNAFGNGGLTGNGLGDSIIKNGFLPQAHTDFILPIIGEELGFLGILILFVLFWQLYKNGILISKNAPDTFSMLLSFGIIASIMIYFLVNASYAVGYAPTTGLPMPFISYGGSHTIFNLISIGILVSIARNNKMSRNSYLGYNYEL